MTSIKEHLNKECLAWTKLDGPLESCLRSAQIYLAASLPFYSFIGRVPLQCLFSRRLSARDFEKPFHFVSIYT